MSILRCLATSLALVALPAGAQTISAFQRLSTPYAPLAGASAVTLSSGEASVSLPFSFPYFGSTFSTAFMHQGGVLGFTSCGTSCNFSSAGVPSNRVTAGRNAILPLFAGSFSTIGLSGGALRRLAGTRDVAFEWSEVRWSGGGNGVPVSFQVRLSESGTFLVHHGPLGGPPAAAFQRAVVGFQDSLGTSGAATLASTGGTCTQANQAGCCSASASAFPFCNATHYVPDDAVLAGAAVDRELLVEGVGFRGLTVGTSSLSFEVAGRVRNLGTLEASGVAWRAWYSTDRVLDAADVAVASGTGVTVAAGATVEVSAPGSLSFVPTGEFWLLLEVDAAGAVTEAFELNNVGTSRTSYVPGTDLVAALVSGPGLTNLANPETVRVQLFNRGLTSAGTVDYRVSLVNGATPVRQFSSARVAVGPAEEVNLPVTETSGCLRLAGDYEWLLEVDPLNRVAESDEANNTRLGNKVLVRLADLEAEPLALFDPVLKRPTARARLGESIDVEFRTRNVGPLDAPAFPFSVAISVDSQFRLPADTIACSLTGAPVPAGQTVLQRGSCPLPLKDSANQDFPSSEYYLAVAVNDPPTICEASQNNIPELVQVRLDAPNPDYEASTLDVPARLAAGETVAVRRTIRNVGNRPLGIAQARPIRYRYVASANDIITAADVPLRQVAPGGGDAVGQVSLLAGEGDTATDLLEVPLGLAAGSYFVGLLLDVEQAVAEIREDNNALAAGPLPVLAPTLRITPGALPDAITGRAYQARLALEGEAVAGPVRWRVVPGLGNLPSGLTLGATTGIISGTVAPTQRPGAVAVLVEATVGGRTTQAALALQVLPPSSPLVVTTVSAPPVPNSSAFSYELQLAASGGARPYLWSFRNRGPGTGLPPGLRLDARTGLVSGRVSAGLGNVTNRVLFQVTDAFGSRAERELTVRVVPPGGLAIAAVDVPPAALGTPYSHALGASRAGDAPGEVPSLTWTVLGGLPPGLTATGDGAFLSLAGTPTRAGTYGFTVTVADEAGRTDTADVTLVVSGEAYRVEADVPAVLRPGESVDVPVRVTPERPVRLRLVGGALPAGLALQQGRLVGTVEAAALEGGRQATYAFSVEARDEAGRVGLGAFALAVVAAPVEEGCGCGATGLTPGLALLALVARRRRATGPARTARS